MISPEKIIVALDTQEKEKIEKLFKSLKDYKIWVKIGMEAYYALGSGVVHQASDYGFKVFLDLKLHDIPNTASQALKSLSRLPINMINVHAAGGKEMMTECVKALKDSPHSPLLIAVTQLTSTSQEQMNAYQQIPGSILDSVLHFAKLAKESGLQGVVSSPLEVKAIKDACGKSFLTVTPGVRPHGEESHDQKRVTTPQEAIRLGTDFMVIGRPITQSQDPKRALESILKG